MLKLATPCHAQPNEVTKQEAANPPYTLAAEKAAGRNGQVNGKTCIIKIDFLENGKISTVENDKWK